MNEENNPHKAAAILAKWCLENRPHDVAHYIRGCLLSLYNGSPEIRLDEIQYVDFHLRKALATVLVFCGSGRSTFYDSDCREAFREVGGEDGVKWFLAGQKKGVRK